PAWEILRANVEEAVKAPDPNSSSAENLTVAYLASGDKRYADAAFKWFKTQSAVDVRGDSYLGFGGLLRGAAFVLNGCAADLSADQKKEIADYLVKWTNELWFDNKGSGWGL